MNRRASSWLRVVPACLAAGLIGCDRRLPVEPAIQAAATGAGGPTVKAPSNTNAVAASESRIDVSWQDNSTNETGFEVWRSPSGLEGTFTKLAGTGANVTKYIDAGLNSLTQYCYRVRGFKTFDGKTSYADLSNTACATTPGPPSPPNAPSATNAVPINSSTVDLTWTDNSASEDGFRVERSVDGGTSWAAVSTTAANVTSLQDGGRLSEQHVCYRVIAFNAGGDSPPSNTDCTAPPAAPTGLTATGLDGPAIDLAWTDNSAVEDGYEVRRSTDGVTFRAVATVASNMTTYRDGSVSENTTYWYVVRAMKDGAFSAPSSVASARAGVLTPPAAPWLQAESRGANWLLFGGSGNADGFDIERCERITCGDAEFGLIATTGPPYWSDFYSDYLSSLFDPAVALGTTYTYRVRAFNRAGHSAWSNLAEVTAIDGY